MDEYIRSEKQTVVEELTQRALDEIERKYGTGVGDGENPKPYHNRVHTQDVLTAAQQLGQAALQAGKIDVSAIPLIELAAGFHDIEQGLGAGLNEEASARIAAEEMLKSGVFTDAEIKQVTAMILATAVQFENGSMKQSATGEYLTQLLADADLASVGQEPSVYWDRALRFLKETQGTTASSKEEAVAFMQSQLAFLEQHHYYTAEAASLVIQQQANIAFVREQLDLLIG
jgi:predicted metal-dependent HD superfamily phosphohydrolase